MAEPRVVRHGRVSWLTHPPGGIARISVDSQAFGALPVSLPDGDPVPHEATPGELLSIAYAMFMAVALSEGLMQAGTPADELVVEASCTFEGPVPDRELVSLDLHASGRVPGLDDAAFNEAAQLARRRALRSVAARDELHGKTDAVLDRAS